MTYQTLVRELSIKLKKSVGLYEAYSSFKVDIGHVRMCISVKQL